MLVIDGHNFIGRAPGLVLGDEQAREELLRRVAASAGDRRDRVVVVFDGNRPGAGKEERFGAVTVVFSPAGRSADDEILRRVSAARCRDATVVTSDRGLARRAQDLGCRVESCEAFRKRLERPARNRVAEKPEASQADVEAWLQTFANRSKSGGHKM